MEVTELRAKYLARSGYKQTEVGVIPEDWEAGPIGRAIDRLEAGASVNSEKDEAPEFDSYPCVLKTGAARDGSFDPWESKRVARRDLWRLKVSLRKDTILVSRMNTVELVGDSGYVDADYPNVFVPDRMWMTTIRSKGHVYPRWLSYILTWQPVKSRIAASATGTSGSMKNITKPSFRAVAIPYPPVQEQRAIAEALHDADALIESLEQLLVKKRNIKQGAMRELLTGKKRLPGFSGAWEVKRLGSTATLKARIGWQGLTTAEYLDSGDFYLVTGTEFKNGFIDWNNCHFVDESRYKQDKNIQLEEHDVLVTKDGTIGKVAWISELPKPAALNSGVFVIRPTEEAFCPMFFYYLLCSNVFTEFLVQLSAGSTINHLYQKDFVGFIYQTPPTITEQTTIAAILSDMDAEIVALEAKLVKARGLKQGMMQELLTGRIRLVEPTQAASCRVC